MLLWQGLLSLFHLTKLDGSAAWLCSPLLLPCRSRRLLGIVPSSRWEDFVPHLPVEVLPAPCQALGCLTNCVLWLSPIPEVTEYALSLGSQMMAKVRTSVGFMLPASSFLAVCGTVLSFRHRLGVFWVQTSSETYCLLQLGSSRSPF